MKTDLRLAAPYAPDALEALAVQFGSPLFVIDCDLLRRQYHALAKALPGVDLHYALKPLPDRTVVQVLAREGSWFDLATNGEVDLVRDAGIPASRCVHTHPIKRGSDIRHALDCGVTTFVVDNAEEIAKFDACRARVRLLLRISFRNPDTIIDLSRKFGCDADAAVGLVEYAAKRSIRIMGFSFHAGSQLVKPDKYVEAIDTCGRLIAEARARGFALDVLDIGGGFPIDYLEPVPAIDGYCAPIRAALARLPESIRVIAEPGRFICGPAAISLSTVMGRARREGRWWYYLDDGIYGTFSGQLYDKMRFPVEPLRGADRPREACVISGPTCDSLDVVAEDLPMPVLEIGERLLARQIGAYTSACATDFNFFPRAKVIAVNVEPGKA
ncbi:MAG TPA: type III PLP-dependent enzyme [Steroidobacteraceae bacterium]